MKEWKSLYESKSGERGIFNRVAAEKQAEKSGRRPTQTGTIDVEYEDGTKRVLEASEKVTLKTGEVVFAYELTEGDEIDADKKD
jgi:hypothetical protein